MTLQAYYNRFDAADRYDELLFRASRGLQSAELNEIQSVLSDRMKRISDVLFKDGGVVRGASATINPQTGAVTMDAGAVYVLGAVREVAGAALTIPTTGSLLIGVRVVTTTITELEDPDLRDPAVGTRNFQEAGAGRTRRIVTWGWSGDGGAGEFFSVYAVLDGVLVSQAIPPELDGVKQLLARYDYDANGSYTVRGLRAIALGKDNSLTNYTFSVTDGVANVMGTKIDKPTATPQAFPINPDLQQINNEPKASQSASAQTLTLNRKPLNDILDVVITAQKTVTLTHGSFSGALDLLPDTAVLLIVSVTQGATTFVAGTSYNLTADQVDWTPAGPEPAPGSTYSVTYQYLTSVEPTNINPDAGTFQITGAVAGSLVLIDYRWKMPRYDVLALDSSGLFNLIKGTSSAFNPIPPAVPTTQLKLCEIYLDWYTTSIPVVNNNGTRVVSMAEQQQVKDSIVELYSLIADERLLRDISSREPTAKYGVFTDPLFDNDLRDSGVEQDAVIVRNELRLAVPGSVVPAPQQNTTTHLLPYTEGSVIAQDLRTGSMQINPYGNFDPVPARVVLTPAVDLWSETDDQTQLDTNRLTTFSSLGLIQRTTTNTVTTLVQNETRAIEFLRQRSVSFTVSGFDANEVLTQLIFDGRNITPNPALVASAQGTLTGTFTVPANVPIGTKLVRFVGSQGNFGNATYTGEGTLTIRRWQSTTTITTEFYDPLAQSFVLEQGRHITGVDLKFATIGNAANPVLVQLREGDNGFPSRNVVADAQIPVSSMTTANTYVRANFHTPIWLESGEEYFIVILTDDGQHAVRVAELGRLDPIANRTVTAQPYTVGVLLSSSNGSTWTPHQDKDLTFRLIGADFSDTTTTIGMGSIVVSGCTDLLINCPVELPTDNTQLRYVVTRSNSEVFNLAPGQLLRFDVAISDTLQIQAVLTGTSTQSPVLSPGTLVVVGALDTAGFYQSREFQLSAGGSTMRVVYEANITGSATVVPQYFNNGFQSLTLTKTTPVGDGWNEYVFSATGITGLTASKVKLNLTGTPGHRPRVRNIRAVMV